jgi:hypothetical protein
MDTQAYNQLQKIKDHLEAIRDGNIKGDESRDYLVASITRIDTMLAIYKGAPPENTGFFSKLKT